MSYSSGVAVVVFCILFKKSHFFSHPLFFSKWPGSVRNPLWVLIILFFFKFLNYFKILKKKILFSFSFPWSAEPGAFLNLKSRAGPSCLTLWCCCFAAMIFLVSKWSAGWLDLTHAHKYKTHWNFRNVKGIPHLSWQNHQKFPANSLLVEKSVCASPAFCTFLFLFIFLPSYCQRDVIYSFYGNFVCWMQFPGRKLHWEMGEEVIIIAIICISPCC